MTSGKSDLVDIDLSPQHETQKAYLVENLSGDKVWIPKSQCEYADGTFTMPEWLAIEKELI